MRLQRKHSAGEPVISADDLESLSRILAGRKLPAPARDHDGRREGPRGGLTLFCPECGSRNSEGADFCVRCGASLIADHPEITLSYEVAGEGCEVPSPGCRRRQ